MKTINIIEALKNVPLSRTRFLEVAKIDISNARIFVESTEEAAKQASLIYSSPRRGMYKRVQADARHLLKVVAERGLTEIKPYWFDHDKTEIRLMVLDNQGRAFPVHIFQQ